jgi:hypothetical protein
LWERSGKIEDSKLKQLKGIWVSYINSPETWSDSLRESKTLNKKKGTAFIIWDFSPNKLGGFNIKRYGGARNFEGYATINHNEIVFYLWEKGEDPQKDTPRFSIFHSIYSSPEDELFGIAFLLIDATWSFSNTNLPMPFIEPIVKLSDKANCSITNSYVDMSSRKRIVQYKNSLTDSVFSERYDMYIDKKNLNETYLKDKKSLIEGFLRKYLLQRPNYINWSDK